MTLRSLIEAWRNDPYYGHGYIVFLISLVYLFFAIKKNIDVKPTSLSRTQFIIATMLTMVVLLFWVIGNLLGAAAGDFLFVLSILLSIKIVSILLWKKNSRDINFPLCYFLFAIPLPFLGSVLFHLQLMTASFVNGVLGLVGVPVHQEGLLIELSGWSFVIGDSCSGFSSSIVLLSLLFLLTKILNWTNKKQLMLLIFVFPVAFIANVTRILFLVGVGQWKGSETAFSYWHNAGGLTFYLLALSGLIYIAYKLNPRSFHEKTFI